MEKKINVDDLLSLFRKGGVERILPLLNGNIKQTVEKAKGRVIELGERFPTITSKPKQDAGGEDPGDKIYQETIAIAKKIDDFNTMIGELEKVES